MTACMDDVDPAGPLARSNARDLNDVLRRHEPWCMRVALRVTKDHHHAQDAVQEAFLAYCREPERFDAGRGNIGSWLAMLTHRRAVDLVRREQARPRPVPAQDSVVSHPCAALDPELQVAESIGAEHLQDLLLTLDPPKRQIIYMAYYLGYTQVQIAAATGMPIGTVKTRNRIALMQLRSAMSAA